MKKIVPALFSFGALAAAMFLCGCGLSSAPIVPQTPANTAQITACESTASLHNWTLAGDYVFGGSTTALASIAAAVPSTAGNQNLKNGLDVAAIVTAAVTVAGTALVAESSSNFSAQKCPSVVGDLPAGTAAP